MPESNLQCPFCEQTSSRPQGLAAHIRNRHPKPYPKWLKTPTRLEDAKKAAGEATKAAEQIEPLAPQPKATEPAVPAAAPTGANGNETLDLLREVHRQLLERKQRIEA